MNAARYTMARPAFWLALALDLAALAMLTSAVLEVVP